MAELQSLYFSVIPSIALAFVDTAGWLSLV